MLLLVGVVMEGCTIDSLSSFNVFIKVEFEFKALVSEDLVSLSSNNVFKNLPPVTRGFS